MTPKDTTLAQLGFPPSVTVLVLPAQCSHQQQQGWSLTTSSRLLLAATVTVLAALALLLCSLTGLAETELAVPVEVTGQKEEIDGWTVVSCVLHYYYSAMGRGMVTICQIIFVCLLFKVISLPYGRLIWVGGYDHQ